MITSRKGIPEYIKLNSENKTQSIDINGNDFIVRDNNGHRIAGITSPLVKLPYEKDCDGVYIVSENRKAKIAPNGLKLSYTEAASLPLGELLARYSDYESYTGYDLQYPSVGLKRFMDDEIPNILYSTGLYITANRKLQPDEDQMEYCHEFSQVINKYIKQVADFIQTLLNQIDEYNLSNEIKIVKPEFITVKPIETIFDSADVQIAIKALTDCENNLIKITIENDTILSLNDEAKKLKKKLKSLKVERLQERILDGRMWDSFAKDVQKIANNPIFKDCAVMLDSGGHQIYMNYLKKRNVGTYIYKYFHILNSLDRINSAFSLDIHMDYPLISDPEEIWDLNCDSIEEMYRHDISKIIWVYQFRGAGLNAIWNALHHQYNIFDHMNKFAIGGVAKASKVGSINFPIFIPASTSIIAGIHKVRNRVKNPVKFDYYQYHILGVATPTDYFQFGLVQRAAERFHDIPLHVTFDSSKVFRGQASGAFMDYMTKHKVIRINFKSNELKNNVEGTTLSNELALRTLIQKLDEKYGYKSCLDEDIYIRSFTDQEIEAENKLFEISKDKFINNLSDEIIEDEMQKNDNSSRNDAILSLMKKDIKLKALMDKIDGMSTKKCLNKKYWTRIIQLSYISMNSTIEEAMLTADIMINIYLATSTNQIDEYRDNYFESAENRTLLPDLIVDDYKNADQQKMKGLIQYKKEAIHKVIGEHLSQMNRNKNTSNLAGKSENTYEAIDLLYSMDEHKAFTINQRLLPEHEIFKHNSNLDFLPSGIVEGTDTLSHVLNEK